MEKVESDKAKAKRWLCITLIAVTAVSLVGAGFYWFSLRPSMIRKECNELALEGSKGARQAIEIPYLDSHLGFNGNSDYYTTEYKTQYIDKSAETYAAAYLLCTSNKGV